jgi:hypothetical protein
LQIPVALRPFHFIESAVCLLASLYEVGDFVGFRHAPNFDGLAILWSDHRREGQWGGNSDSQAVKQLICCVCTAAVALQNQTAMWKQFYRMAVVFFAPDKQ